ncbi:M20 aminoacylase family protein [Ensifer adhaerens]|uniref:M20 aminoacylase family protein n=1 Tax=Ensifer adhaerens TaxID=106592 RepID=UPI001F3F67CD|nr:M20 aminoacylase family protein [Ensifer adhaerens]
MKSHVLPEIAAVHSEAVALRRRIHANPELGFEEFATSELVAEYLTQCGYEVTRGLGGTGVVGTLRRGIGPSVGLRADMDALPIEEETNLPYSSLHAGKMHACGHDGHTATLLAAARHIARTSAISGTLHLIFQPAEEGKGGAALMIEDGLLERFPCDAVFALHNMPGVPVGKFGFLGGPFLASADTVTVRIHGRGGHGAVPHKAIDPILVCSAIVMALQTIVSRNVDPQETAIISAGSIHAGVVSNVIPQSAEMILTVRALKREIRELLEQRIAEVVHAQAASFGASAEIDYVRLYPVLVNSAAETNLARDVAREWFGEENLIDDLRPITGSEDFAFVLEKCPGSYLVTGNGDSLPLHHPGYDFNDDVLAVGATYWVKLVERFLAVPVRDAV